MYERRCFHCGIVLTKTRKGVINKMFCCQEHKNAFYLDRKAEARAAVLDRTRKPACYCENKGCKKRLARYQKRFCCVACRVEVFFETHDRALYEGLPVREPDRASYTMADVVTVRDLFFKTPVSLREISRKTGFSLGVVTRIIYAKKTASKEGPTP